MTFDDMWRSLEEKDTTGKYKQAREMAELGMEQQDYNESCRYGCNQCGNLNNIPGNFCPNCGARMVKNERNSC